MLPTLEPGSRVLVLKFWPTKFIRKGQIVLLTSWPESGEQKYFIKRIIAIQNSCISSFWIEFRLLEGILIKNMYDFFATRVSFDTKVNYVSELDSDPRLINLQETEEYSKIIVPPRHFFVKGDWLLGGDDSLNRGPVPYHKLAGIVIAKLG